MCGIVGYIGPKQAASVVLDGLKRLEYRGYDSAGIAVLKQNGGIDVTRAVGKLHNLSDRLMDEPMKGHIGIGHTRWATHGGVTELNAHPHIGMNGRVAVVHNGIIENYATLRREMTDEGYVFQSETDTEVIANLVDGYLAGGDDLLSAVQKGAAPHPGRKRVRLPQPPRTGHARRSRGWAMQAASSSGWARARSFIASDIPAILEYTRDVIFLENRQIAQVTRMASRSTGLDGTPVTAARCNDPLGSDIGGKRTVSPLYAEGDLANNHAPSPIRFAGAWISIVGACSLIRCRSPKRKHAPSPKSRRWRAAPRTTRPWWASLCSRISPKSR